MDSDEEAKLFCIFDKIVEHVQNLRKQIDQIDIKMIDLAVELKEIIKKDEDIARLEVIIKYEDIARIKLKQILFQRKKRCNLQKTYDSFYKLMTTLIPDSTKKSESSMEMDGYDKDLEKELKELKNIKNDLDFIKKISGNYEETILKKEKKQIPVLDG
jgi:hypothetical protein